MILDMHLHEKTFSKDSVLSLEEIVTLARARGVDGVCITDHESMALREEAARYARQVRFPILVGAEYLTAQGDITAFGLPALPATPRMGAQQYIDLVRQAGGICFACHPFRNNNRGLEEHLLDVHGLTGIEVFNGSTSPQANARAADYCRRLGLQPIGASDAHIPEKVGVCVTEIPGWAETVEELIHLFCTQRARALWRCDRYPPETGRAAPANCMRPPVQL